MQHCRFLEDDGIKEITFFSLMNNTMKVILSDYKLTISKKYAYFFEIFPLEIKMKKHMDMAQSNILK